MDIIFRKIRSQKGSSIFLGVVFALFLMLALTRMWAAILLRFSTNAYGTPTVSTIAAISASADDEIVLPGTILAWHEAPVYARVKGYIKQWRVDIGDKVKKGDLLAVIDAPELDAQLRQAEADLKVAIANYELAQVTAKRWINLVKTDSVSKQETDEKIDSEKALKAVVLSEQANRDRLRELVGFERIIAPFSGIISSRLTDIGALINSGSNPAEAKPLFRIASHNPLRLYVKVPENYASRIKEHLEVQLAVAEHPGLLFPAKLFQTAEAIDLKTRTLLTQFTVQNKEKKLLPGGYTQVHIKLQTSSQAVQLPVNTLLFRAQGLQVATLDKTNHVVLKSITIGRDFGETVEIDFGVKPGEAIIVNPSDGIYNGQKVQLAKETSSHE